MSNFVFSKYALCSPSKEALPVPSGNFNWVISAEQTPPAATYITQPGPRNKSWEGGAPPSNLPPSMGNAGQSTGVGGGWWGVVELQASMSASP